MTKAKGKRGNANLTLITINPSTNIPLDKLTFSESNVRQIEPDREVEHLARSIERRSLLQSLSVRAVTDETGAETGLYAVQGGGRRLRALQLLAAQSRIALDTPIPCIIKTGGSAVEDSLAENSDRESLHPVDQYRAFAALKAEGKGDEDIAAAFGVTAQVVRQRLRLAAASPALLDAYIAEEIDLDALMAFCVTDDTKRQEQVWASFKGQNYMPEYRIKQLLTENTVIGTDRRARFVGLDAYIAAGGTVIEDLFDNDGDGCWLQDPVLLMKLTQEKLDSLRDAQLAAGWKWAEAAVEIPYSTKSKLEQVDPANALTDADQEKLDKLCEQRDELDNGDELSPSGQKKLAAIEAKIAAYEDRKLEYAAEDIARAGVFISLTHQGGVEIDYGFVKDEDQPQLEAADEGSVPAADAESGDEPTEAITKPLADRLVQDLTSYRTVALRNALADNYHAAFLATVHAMCLSQFYTFSGNSCLQLTVRKEFPATAEGLAEWPATKTLDKRARHFQKLMPKEPEMLWDTLSGMDEASLQLLFAHCVSQTVNAVREPHVRRTDALRHSEQLGALVGLDMVKVGWTAKADTLFSRMTKPQILDAVREAKGDDTAEMLESLKKEQMAREAERLVAGTGWLPEPLRASSGTAVDTEALPEELPAFLSNPDEAPQAA